MYATVVLQVEKRLQVLTIPTEAVAGDKKKYRLCHHPEP